MWYGCKNPYHFFLLLRRMVHHVKIIPYGKRKFKNKCPFELVFSPKETIKYSEPRYKIRVSDEENERIWMFIEALTNQMLNKSVNFFHIPCFWDKQEYAFYALVHGNKTEIKGIYEIISKDFYPKSTIEFEY